MSKAAQKTADSALSQVNVICMKWGTKYGPEYVNRLYRGVTRHLNRPHRFVCFTDDAAGIDPGVEVMPLPDLGLPPSPERGWFKLATFAPTLFDLKGHTLFLDLDLVIVAELDVFFELPGRFYIMRDFKRPGSKVGNSSVYRFEVSDLPQILSNFVADFDGVRRRHRNEQEYLTQAAEDLGVLAYWPSDLAVSYKKHCVPTFPLNYWRAPTCPADTRIVVFHGEVNPPDALAGRRNRRLRHLKPSPWIARHWIE